MANESKIVFESAISQLEAQKAKVFAQAKQVKFSELKPQLEEYERQRSEEYQNALNALKTTYDEALRQKREEINAQAGAYANARVAVIDEQIGKLREMADSCGDD